jgi:hypothetical protein
MLHLLDIFFVVFHTSLILFNLFGWIWKRTRAINLISLLLTGGSWLVPGLNVGTIGFCPLTQWHFIVLEKLGVTDLPLSYVKYLADRLTGSDFSPVLTDNITLWSYILALIVSVSLVIRDIIRKSRVK